MKKIANSQLKEIGNRVRNARYALEIDQKELAKRSGLSQSFISKIETGHLEAGILRFSRIASVLGLRVDTLINGYTSDKFEKALKDMQNFGHSTVDTTTHSEVSV